MENIIFWVIIIIIAIGAFVISIPILGVAIWLWWVTIPIVCAYFGGTIGLFFGVGLDVVIGIIYLAIKGLISDFRDRNKNK